MGLLKPIREFFFKSEALRIKDIEVDVQKNAVDRLYRDNEKLHEINSDLRGKYDRLEEKLTVIYDDYNKLRGDYNTKNERMSELVTVMTQIYGSLDEFKEGNAEHQAALMKEFEKNMSVMVGFGSDFHELFNRNNKTVIGSRDMILKDTRNMLTEGQMDTFAKEVFERLDTLKDEVTTFTESTELRDGIEEVRSLIADDVIDKLNDICMDNIYDAVRESTEELWNDVRDIKNITTALKNKDDATNWTALAKSLDAMNHKLGNVQRAIDKYEGILSWMREITKTVDKIHDNQAAPHGDTQQKVLEALASVDEPLTSKALRELTGLTKNQVGGAISKLVKHRKVIRIKTGVFKLVRVDLSLLERIDPNDDEAWADVGNVIKAEGMNYGEWHQWSQIRTNYSKEACEKKWNELDAEHGDKSHSWANLIEIYS